MSKLIIAVHFDIECDDAESIIEIVDLLSDHFDNIINIDLLAEEDYHADIHGETKSPVKRLGSTH